LIFTSFTVSSAILTVKTNRLIFCGFSTWWVIVADADLLHRMAACAAPTTDPLPTGRTSLGLVHGSEKRIQHLFPYVFGKLGHQWRICFFIFLHS